MAANPELSDVTVIRPTGLPAKEKPGVPTAAAALLDRPAFWRRSVPLSRSFTSKQQLMALAVIIAALLLVGVTMAIRLRNTSPSTEAALTAAPSPTVVPSPSPSPTPTPLRVVQKPTPTPKKQSKGGFVNKVKRIFKNPF
jgi:hypothetical protein